MGCSTLKPRIDPVARDHVAERVRLRVTHVQVARGVREHVEHVLGGPGVARIARAEGLLLCPHRKPPLLDRAEVVAGIVSCLSWGGHPEILSVGVSMADAGPVCRGRDPARPPLSRLRSPIRRFSPRSPECRHPVRGSSLAVGRRRGLAIRRARPRGAVQHEPPATIGGQGRDTPENATRNGGCGALGVKRVQAAPDHASRVTCTWTSRLLVEPPKTPESGGTSRYSRRAGDDHVVVAHLACRSWGRIRTNRPSTIRPTRGTRRAPSRRWLRRGSGAGNRTRSARGCRCDAAPRSRGGRSPGIRRTSPPTHPALGCARSSSRARSSSGRGGGRRWRARPRRACPCPGIERESRKVLGRLGRIGLARYSESRS